VWDRVLGGGTVAREGTYPWVAVARAEQPGLSFSLGPARGWPVADGEEEPSVVSDAPRRSQRLHGRLAAVFFAGSGALVLLTLPLPVPGLNVTVMAEVGLAALAIGIVAWLVPWGRWQRQASLVLVVPAFALIALANTYGLDGLQPYGVFYLVCFVWLGMAHPPRTSVAVAPLAAIAYVLPWLHLHDNGPRAYAAAITIPLCVLVAEGIAWTGAKLERSELALQREKDRTERLRELDEAKDKFLSAVSHELRNPITICRGHLEVLDDEAGQQEIMAVKETLISEFDLMGRLVEDLTTLARVDDRAQLRMASLPLDRFVTSIAKQAEPILGQRLRVESGVPSEPLRADPQRLRQALLNLLRNAAEHARGDGPVRFRVAADQTAWRFEVADEGGGLPLGDEQAVFEPFQTGSSVTGGTGLGLSLVRGIARAHGGESGVVNRPGQGATFWIRIPR
jgi:signal transduction histidine kinase